LSFVQFHIQFQSPTVPYPMLRGKTIRLVQTIGKPIAFLKSPRAWPRLGH
jgi:hypothetical protein